PEELEQRQHVPVIDHRLGRVHQRDPGVVAAVAEVAVLSAREGERRIEARHGRERVARHRGVARGEEGRAAAAAVLYEMVDDELARGGAGVVSEPVDGAAAYYRAGRL